MALFETVNDVRYSKIVHLEKTKSFSVDHFSFRVHLDHLIKVTRKMINPDDFVAPTSLAPYLRHFN
jgi:hypothetical protein